MSKYGVFPVPYFSGPIYSVNLRIQFSPNTGKYGSEKIPYLDNFLAVIMFKIYQFVSSIMESQKQLPRGALQNTCSQRICMYWKGHTVYKKLKHCSWME